MQNILDRARVLLQDDKKVRFKDPDCLAALNQGIKEAKRWRSDLFFGQYGTPYVDLAVGDPFPLPPEYEYAAITSLVAFCDARESEYSEDQRVVVFMQVFKDELLG